MERNARRARRTAAVAAVTLPLALLGAAGAAGPADAVAAACSGVPKDINGDGFGDLAVGEDGGPGGGRVNVFYGSATGLAVDPTGDAPNDQIFSQGVGGVPGVGAKGDAFGATTLLDDLNNDGCADLVVGLPGNNTRTGAVVVLLGSTTGIRTAGARLITQDSLASGQGSATTEDEFGSSAIGGDFNGDGLRDLAVGAPFDLPPGRTTGFRGTVSVFYGSATGLLRGGTELVSQDYANVFGNSEDGDAFGFQVVSGDFTADGIDDLVVGVPGENAEAGLVQIVPGNAGGLSVATSIELDQGKPGIPGTPGAGDDFGLALATGDINGDSAPDLVTGNTGEGNGAGSVTVILSDPATKRLTGTGAQSFSQNTAGVDGTGAKNDRFGFAVAVGNLDSDGFADVAVSTPFDAIGAVTQAGSVTLLKGTASGLTTAGYGGLRISQNTTGIPGGSETNDRFGFGLVIRKVQGPSSPGSLVVGAFGESLGTVSRAGTFTVLHPSATGPSFTSVQGFDNDSPGIQGGRATNGALGFMID